MTPSKKAHQLKNDFGELAEKVVDEIISTLKECETYKDVNPNLPIGFWQEVKNELKKIK